MYPGYMQPTNKNKEKDLDYHNRLIDCNGICKK